MASDTKKEDDIICTCTGTTKAKVKQLFEKGYDNLDKIASATGATTGCGSCDILVLEELENAKILS